MKKLFYILVTIFQAFVILSSIVNIIYCAITGEQILFMGSLYLFVPYSRFIKDGNIADIFVLLLFISITIIFFVFATKELLNKETRKAPFMILNTFWYTISVALIMLFLDENFLIIDFSKVFFDGVNGMISICFPGFVYLMICIAQFLKIADQQKIIRSKPDPSKEEFLPENFQMRSISYRQIKRTALGTPVIASVCFLLCLYIWYLNGILVVGTIYFLYALSSAFIIIIFIGTIIECKSFEKRSGKKPPREDFLKRLNIMQIVSFLSLVLSFLLFTFVLL